MNFAPAPILHVVVGAALVRAEARRDARVIWAGEAEYRTMEDLTEVVARLAAAPAERCRRLRVTIECPPGQRRALTDLPPVPERELAALVATQAGRFFRRNGAPLVTDAVWVTKGKGPGHPGLTQAAAVAEPLVIAIGSGAAQAGLLVESIGPAGMSPLLQLLPSAEKAVRLRARRRAVTRLGVAVAGIWLVAVALFSARLLLERRSMDTELSAAATPLAALGDVRREMRSAESMVLNLIDARKARGEALATLARVHGAIPDSTVLTSYTWRADGSGIIAGAGRRASDVLSAMERRQSVSNPRMSGAVVRETIAGHEWERFTILFGPVTTDP